MHTYTLMNHVSSYARTVPVWVYFYAYVMNSRTRICTSYLNSIELYRVLVQVPLQRRCGGARPPTGIGRLLLVGAY